MPQPRAFSVALLLLTICNLRAAADSPSTRPTLTEAEKKAGWVFLFDGATTAGWRGLGSDAFPSTRWRIDDGCLHCLGGDGRTNDIITTAKYQNFELVLQWRVPRAPGNTGIKYRIQEKPGDGFAFGPEYQIMYDPGVNDKHATGSLYDIFPPQGKTLRPLNEFNDSRILVTGNHVEHWLNGVKVVEFEFNGNAIKAGIAQSKFKGTDWAKNPLGYIALQDHHDEAFFRNIKLRELPASIEK